jgi:hypothetical protein
LVAIISSHKSLNSFKISAFDSSPKALSTTETGIFLFLSIFTLIIPFFSTSISNQLPFAGITLSEYHPSPTVKNIPVERIIWFTITLSIPFTIKAAELVMRGIPHMYTSCSLISHVSLLSISNLILSGAS